MKFRNIAALLALSATLTACVSGKDDTTTYDKPTAGFQAQFNPSLGILPFPNDLYSNPTTGKIDIPGDPTVPANGPILALNHLDGYGTQSDIKVYFTAPVDASSLNKSDIIVVKASSDPSSKAVTGVVKQLHEDVDYSVSLSPGTDSDGMVVNITPLHPLDPSTVDPVTHIPTFATYLVIVTSGVKTAGGGGVEQSAEFKAIVAADTPAITATGADPTKIAMPKTDPLYPVALFSLGQLAVAAHAKIPLSDVAVTFSFSTQFLGVTLADMSQHATAGTGTVANTGLDTKTATGGAALGLADVWVGTVTIPYYLAIPNAQNPTAALTGYWHTASNGDTTVLDPLPQKTASVTIPVMVTVPIANNAANGGCPAAAMPGTGWPVVIFQHGITQNRTNVLGVGDALAAACFAAVAIDLPLHGITDTSTDVTKNPFYENQLLKGTAASSLVTGERTFNMDLQNNTTGAAGPDGVVDGSGVWFINLSSTLTSRDNLREAAADLIALTRTIQANKLTALGGSFTLDGSQIGFVGHSLGAIVGTTYLAVDPSTFAATLGMPGGHIAKLLIDSPAFASQINQGLAAEGLATDTQEYYDFLNEAQAVVEDGDPANYAAEAAAQHPIHMIEVVGDGTTANLPDQVVPNSATDVLIAQMGITKPISTVGLNPVAAGVGSSTLAQFTAGTHSSLLQPSAATALQLGITTEMQTEMASLFGAAGAAVKVADNSHLTTTLKK